MESEYKYNSVQIARYIVAVGNARAIPMNMTKTQKLLYITYGMYLAKNDGRLFSEHPQCWPYGPVFPTTRNRLLKTDMPSLRLEDERKGIEDGVVQLVADVFDKFGQNTAKWLSEWSHQPNSPWDITTRKTGFIWGMTIDDEDIKRYFSEL